MRRHIFFVSGGQVPVDVCAAARCLQRWGERSAVHPRVSGLRGRTTNDQALFAQSLPLYSTFPCLPADA